MNNQILTQLFEQIEQAILDTATRIADSAARFFTRRMAQHLKDELKFVYDKKEAAKFLRVSEGTVSNLIKTGQLAYYKYSASPSGRVTVGLHHLLCYLQRHEMQTFAPNRIKFKDFYTLKSGDFEVTGHGLQIVDSTNANSKKHTT